MALAALSSLAFAPSLPASPVGSIAGVVKDATGGSVAQVKVSLTNTSTNFKTDTLTDPNGEFQFPQLAPATYSLTAEAQGFRKISVESVLVQVDQITHVDLSLEVGSVTESVQVAGVATLLETDKSTLSSVVNSRDIANLPLNARQVLDLALVTPGVVPTAAGTQVLSFNVAGARSQSNVFLWDGVSNMDTQVDGALNNFRITDAVQEFSVQTSVASAEFGRGSGGAVDVVTKSGTNQFHGSAFEYLRNSDLDAADFFTNRNRAPKTPLHRNQYGGTFGGPILRERTFFFASYEGFRQVAPTVSATRVPTDAERAQVTDPISKNLLQFWPAPNTSVPGSANNYIANVRASTFDNTGLIKIDHRISDKDTLSGRYAEYQGTTFTPGTLPLLGGNGNTPISRNVAVVETHSFSPTLLNEFRVGYSRNQTKITVQDNGFNAASVFQINGQPLPGVVDGTKNVQDSGLPTITVAGGYAVLGSTNNLPQGRITNTYELFDNVSWIGPFHATRHSFRFGFHIRRELARRYLDGSARGVFNLVNWSDFAAGLVNTSTFRSGNTLAYWDRFPFDLYWQDQYKVRENLTINYGVRFEYPSAIYQTRQDATNFIPGVGPVLLGTNQLLKIDPTKTGPASLVLAPAPVTVSNSGVLSDKNNIAPVFGIAYTPRNSRLFGSNDTVIRAGFRVGYDDIFNNIPANMGLNPPYNLLTSQAAGTTQPGKFPWAVGYDQNVPLVKFNASGQPLVGLLAFNAEDPNIRSAYLYQYNFGIQRRIGSDFSLEVDYQGSTGHKLGLFVDQNQPAVTVNNPALRGNQAPNVQTFPYPVYGGVSTGKDIGNSNYNGLVAIAKYQSRHGYFVQASYVFSKSLDTNSAFFGSTGERTSVADAYHISLDRGPSSFDTRHHASILYNLDVPAGPGHRLFGANNGFNRQVFGGWSVSGLVTAQTGQPFTVYDTSQDYSGFNQFNDRPDLIGTGPLPQNNRNPDNAFGTLGAGRGLGYFSATPPTGRIGTSGRNQFYGPGLFNWDLAASKNFPIYKERVRLQFRADFFNLFNHTNFANPVHDESNANFGKITQTLGSAVATSVGTTAGAYGAARQIQFSMRLSF
jgi:hypothetical protein